MTGSSGRQRVPTASFSCFFVASPSHQLAELFGNEITPLFARATAAIRDARTLAAMRDVLPELISGRPRMNDDEGIAASRATTHGAIHRRLASERTD